MSATENRTDQPTVAVISASDLPISSVINLTHSPVLMAIIFYTRRMSVRPTDGILCVVCVCGARQNAEKSNISMTRRVVTDQILLTLSCRELLFHMYGVY
jgi:hypothetical protein